jgi:hypothetical protein
MKAESRLNDGTFPPAKKPGLLNSQCDDLQSGLLLRERRVEIKMQKIAAG